MIVQHITFKNPNVLIVSPQKDLNIDYKKIFAYNLILDRINEYQIIFEL